MTAIPHNFFLPDDVSIREFVDGRRIALFSGAYNHIADGVALTLNRLVAFLEDHGAEVLIFAPTIPDPPIRHAGTLDPVRSISLPGRPDYRVSMVLSRDQARRLRAFKPDLIHIATPDFLGMDALRHARRLGVPIVASYHTHFTSYLAYYRLGWTEKVLWRYLRIFYRQTEHLYVPTPTMAAVLRENGIDAGIHLWPRGVETSRFHPDLRDYSWRRSLGIEDHEVVVSFVSRLVWEKGLEVFIDTLQRLRAKGVPHRALIVGDGPARDELAQRIPGALFTGYLRDHKLAVAYASSDVFLFPSDTETFGNVTLEAMASGLPTVCADATGSDALVRHGRTGFLVANRDGSEYARRVAALVGNRDLRLRLGTEARAEAERYDWPIVLGRIAEYYSHVLDGPTVHGPAPMAEVVRNPRAWAVPA